MKHNAKALLHHSRGELFRFYLIKHKGALDKS